MTIIKITNISDDKECLYTKIFSCLWPVPSCALLCPLVRAMMPYLNDKYHKERSGHSDLMFNCVLKRTKCPLNVYNYDKKRALKGIYP